METVQSIPGLGYFNLISISIIPVVLLIFVYSRYKLTYWKRRGLEQLPNTNIIFGNFKDAVLFRSSPGWHIGKLYREAKPDSPYVGIYIFHKPCILLRDPDIIKQIFVRDFENFTDRHFAGTTQKDSIGMKNLFGIRNPVWKYLRSKMTPTLTPHKLKLMFPLMTETGKPMMDYLMNGKINEINGKKIIDLQRLNYTFTTDLIANVVFGTKVDSFNYPNGKFTKAVVQYFYGFKRMIALVTVFFLPELVNHFGSLILFDSQFLRKIFWDAVKLREESGFKRGDFVDSLIQLKNGEQNPILKFEGDSLVHQAGTLFSGLESSSTTTAFTLMELARNTECQTRARQDILNAIELHGWTYEAFNEMKYLDQCIAEGVRLHPPVSTIDRFALNDYKIPGSDVTIEKGTPVYVSLYGLHEDPRFFHEPLEFNPDRFGDGEKISDAYMPFGIGPRMCIGMKVGQLHAKIVIAMILKEYELYQHFDDKSELDTRSTLTAAARGIDVEFRKIN